MAPTGNSRMSPACAAGLSAVAVDFILEFSGIRGVLQCSADTTLRPVSLAETLITLMAQLAYEKVKS